MNVPDTETTAPDKPETPAAAAETPASAPPAAETTEVGSALAKLESDLAAAKRETAEHYERYLRTVADMENFRKRTVREKDELRQYAAAKVLEDLIPVLDNLALGLAAARTPSAELKSLVGGVEMVLTQAKSALAQHGLKEINPLGQPFDPNQHESISLMPSATVPEGAVATVVRTGYSLNGRLLRPASVVLSSGAPAKEEASG
jgi:molecular chaperone GrpE